MRGGVHVIVLLGPPGAGKGTQGALLAERCGARHISTGSLLRDEVASGSHLGLQIRDIMARGELVSDGHLFACLEHSLASLSRSAEAQGTLVVLDGVPRNLAQVGLLDAALDRAGVKVDGVLELQAPLEKLVDRFQRRWTCSSCGSILALESAPAAGSACPRCGTKGSLGRRDDDAPEAVRRRLAVYQEATAPVSAAYGKRGILEVIDGLLDPEGTHLKVLEKIAKIFPLSSC